jgi:hypothetical protein
VSLRAITQNPVRDLPAALRAFPLLQEFVDVATAVRRLPSDGLLNSEQERAELAVLAGVEAELLKRSAAVVSLRHLQTLDLAAEGRRRVYAPALAGLEFPALTCASLRAAETPFLHALLVRVLDSVQPLLTCWLRSCDAGSGAEAVRSASARAKRERPARWRRQRCAYPVGRCHV